ncbi:MAG TPA: hypothetical protein VF620_10510 [Allosphingosinicella sp.]
MSHALVVGRPADPVGGDGAPYMSGAPTDRALVVGETQRQP